MKKLFTFLLLLLSKLCSAQTFDYCYLDPASPCQHQFIIDTIHYPNNIWQIGRPQKIIFDTPYSKPFAIVTDTINTYPTNDTSVFIVKHIKSKFSPIINVFALHFWYKLDIDSGEIAKIEVSGDSGLHWVDVLKEDTTYDFILGSPKPRLDTSTHGWKRFSLHMSAWGNAAALQKTYPSYVTADTFLYRFTFISDSAQTNKEGWMLDNFFFEDWTESIVETTKNDNLISIYPNPSDGQIFLKHNLPENKKTLISIYNAHGQEVYHTESIPQNGLLDLSLPDGVYYLKYMADEQYAVKRINVIN